MNPLPLLRAELKRAPRTAAALVFLVALAVALAHRQRQLMAIGLYDLPTKRGGDDAGQAGASAKFQYASVAKGLRARCDLMREGDRGGPEVRR